MNIMESRPTRNRWLAFLVVLVVLATPLISEILVEDDLKRPEIAAKFTQMHLSPVPIEAHPGTPLYEHANSEFMRVQKKVGQFTRNVRVVDAGWGEGGEINVIAKGFLPDREVQIELCMMPLPDGGFRSLYLVADGEDL